MENSDFVQSAVPKSRGRALGVDAAIEFGAEAEGRRGDLAEARAWRLGDFLAVAVEPERDPIVRKRDKLPFGQRERHGVAHADFAALGVMHVDFEAAFVVPKPEVELAAEVLGAETIRIRDLEAITGLTSGSGFVRLRVSLDANGDSTYEAQATTEVGGWVKSALGTTCRTYNNPFISCPVFSGTVDSVSGNNLVLTTSAAGLDLSTVLTPGSSYFVEVTSGIHEGLRFDVTSGAVNSLTLANDASLSSALPPFNTALGAPPSTLAGASFAVRKHWTLGTMFPPASFLATDSQTTADQVQVFVGGAWTSYWLYDDDLLSTSNTLKWLKIGVANTDDQSAVVIPPGQGTFINCRQVSGSLLAFGKVRENDFALPLSINASLVGGGYPLAESPASRGMTLANGFDGDRDYKLADMFYVWRGDTTVGATGYDTYYLLDGSPLQSAIKRWVKIGDAFITPRDGSALFLTDRSVFLDLNQNLPGNRVMAPWTP